MLLENVQEGRLDFSGQDLRGTSFEGLSLKHANFSASILKNCNFKNCDLSFADFSNADLYRADFSNSTLYVTSFRGADLTRASFTDADLYGIKLFNADVTKTQFDTTIREEKNYEKAVDIYNTLKRVYKEHGEITLSANYYYRQRVCQRKLKKYGLCRLIDLVFLDWLVGYGENPERSIIWSVLIIVIFAFIYLSLPFWDLGALLSENKLLHLSVRNVPLALLFSVTAFVGADFVRWDIIGCGRFFATMESLLGMILVSIILIGFARKIVRD
jgi:hypothetical protein